MEQADFYNEYDSDDENSPFTSENEDQKVNYLDLKDDLLLKTLIDYNKGRRW